MSENQPTEPRQAGLPDLRHVPLAVLAARSAELGRVRRATGAGTAAAPAGPPVSAFQSSI
jgi:hypothetical protein